MKVFALIGQQVIKWGCRNYSIVELVHYLIRFIILKQFLANRALMYMFLISIQISENRLIDGRELNKAEKCLRDAYILGVISKKTGKRGIFLCYVLTKNEVTVLQSNLNFLLRLEVMLSICLIFPYLSPDMLISAMLIKKKNM